MAHESYHASQDGYQADSVQEEVKAYQYEYQIGSLLNSWSDNKKANLDFASNFKDLDPANEEKLRQAQGTLSGGPDKKDKSDTEKMYGGLPLFPPSNGWDRFTITWKMAWTYRDQFYPWNWW